MIMVFICFFLFNVHFKVLIHYHFQCHYAIIAINMESIMTTNSESLEFGKKTKYISDVLGYLVAGLYTGSAFIYFLNYYHLALRVYLIMTVYFVVMSSLIIYRMVNIESLTERVKNALLASITEALTINFSFLFYHLLLLVGLILPFVMPNTGSLSQAFAVIVGLLEVIMLATAKTLQNNVKKEQP